MGAFDLLMKYYPFIFHPGVMVGGGTLLLIHTEWGRQDAPSSVLWKRIGVFAALGLLSLVPTLAYMLVTGSGPMETMQGNTWQVDFLVGSGFALVAGAMWLTWRRLEWGRVVPRAMTALAAVVVPYVGLSLVWNVSGHVIAALTPTLALVLVQRRYWPLLAIPILMVYNRPYIGAHTWAQAVTGFVVAALIVLAVFPRRLTETPGTLPGGAESNS